MKEKETFHFFNIEKTRYKSSWNIQKLLQKHSKEWVEGDKEDKIFTYSDENDRSKIKTYIDGSFEIFEKHRLAWNFRNHQFMPKSYIIEGKRNTLPEFSREGDVGIWFIKPSSKRIGSGKGIHVIKISRKGEPFRKIVFNKIKGSRENYLIQKNVEHPFLFDGKRKSDIRVFGVVVNTPDGEIGVYLSNNGFIRFAISDFDENKFDDEKVFLTNVSIFERLFPDRDSSEVTQILEMDKTFFEKLRGIVKTIFTGVKLFPVKNEGGFVIFGLDIMVDTSGNIFVLEVNHHPFTYEDFEKVKTIPPEGITTHRFFFESNFYKYVFGSILKNKIIRNDKSDKFLKNIF